MYDFGQVATEWISFFYNSFELNWIEFLCYHAQNKMKE